MKKFSIFTAALCVLYSVFAAADWSGIVSDTSGQPIAQVCVSDGLTVVQSDAAGKFTLPTRDGARFIFLSMPAGFKAQDKFYQKIESGKSEYNFTLTSFAPSQGDTVRFIQVSDVEQSGGDTRWMDTIRNFVKETPCAFFISTGDICYPPGLRFNAEKVTDASMGLPVYHSIGNHDLVSGKYGEELYESLFGPAWYSFNAGPTHFIVTPMPGGDYRASYSTAQIAQWLKNDLAQLKPATPTVMFQHTAPGYGKFNNERSFKYGDIDLKTINLKGWFFGHYHTSVFDTNPETGIIFGSAAPPNKGGIDHSVASFYVYTMNKNGFESIDKRNSFWDKFTVKTPEIQGESLLTLRWTAQASGEIHFGAPVPFDSGVITATADDGNRKDCAIIRFDKSGSPVWKTPVDNSIKCALSADEDRVYAMDQAWTVYALDIHTGKILWKDAQGAEPTSMMGAPVLKDGVLYAGQGAGLTAYDAPTGKILWRNNAYRDEEGTTAANVIIGDMVLSSRNWRDLHAHDLKTGKPLWGASYQHLRFRSSDPVPFTNKDGKDVILLTNGNAIQTLNRETGALMDNVNVGHNLQSASAALLYDKMILVGSVNIGLCAFNSTDFSFLWNVKTGDNLTYSAPYSSPVQSSVEATPVRWGKYVIFGALDGKVYVIDPTETAEKRVVETIDLGAPILSTAAVSPDGKTVFITDYAGRVHAFDAK